MPPPNEREELELRKQLQSGSLSPREELDARRRLAELDAPSRDSLMQSFNRGVMSTLTLPHDLTSMVGNLALSAEEALGFNPRGTRIDVGAPARDFVARTGLTADQPREGFLPRAAQIVGGGVLPTAGLLRAGQVLADDAGRAIQQALPSASVRPENVLATAGRRPVATMAGEAVASMTAAGGGEITEEFTDNPALIALGEIAGGFSPVAFSQLRRLPSVRALENVVASTVAPFTRRGGELRAARRLQSLSSEPEEAAAAVLSGDENLSPARRTGDRRLLALENNILKTDPSLEDAFSTQLREAMESALLQARQFGGDADRVRKILRSGRDYVLHLLRTRATAASERATAEIEALGPNATPRQISRVARQHLGEALEDARAQERQLWGEIDKDAPASLETASETLNAELSIRGRFHDPDDIPRWLRLALDPTQPPVALNDVQALRSRVLQEIRSEAAKDAPNRNKLRILGDVQEALLADMGATSAEGVPVALAFSRELNERFTRGAVGRVLGNDRTGGAAVSGADMMDRILSGSAGTNVEQFLRANPNAADDVLQFLKSRYVEQVTNPGFRQGAHNAFMARYRRTGVWEQFPELEQQLLSAGRSQEAARRLGVRAERASRVSRSPARSRAALYLEAPVGHEMEALMGSRNPVQAALAIRRRVGNDRVAQQGLKEQFVDELLRQSQGRGASGFDADGNPRISGNVFNRLLSENRRVARALGFDEGEMQRLSRTSDTLRRIERTPADIGKGIVGDLPAAVLDFVARIAGARLGANAAQGAGFGTLVGAQAGSQRMRTILERLTNDRARQLLIEAHTDPQLYAALLTKSTDSPERVRRAADRLNSWLIGVGATQDEER